MNWLSILAETATTTAFQVGQWLDRHSGLATWCTGAAAVWAAWQFGARQVQIQQRQVELQAAADRRADLELLARWAPPIRGGFTSIDGRYQDRQWLELSIENTSDQDVYGELSIRLYSHEYRPKPVMRMNLGQKRIAAKSTYRVCQPVPTTCEEAVFGDLPHVRPTATVLWMTVVPNGRPLWFGVNDYGVEIDDGMGWGLPHVEHRPPPVTFRTRYRRRVVEPTWTWWKYTAKPALWQLKWWFRGRVKQLSFWVWYWRLPEDQKAPWRRGFEHQREERRQKQSTRKDAT